jgi:hypothetical protein
VSRFPLLRLLLALSLAVPGSSLMAADEATVITAYLYNFAKYIQWPDERRSTLLVCEFGSRALGKSLDALIGKPVRNMQMNVRHAVSPQDTPQCDMVFVSADQSASLERVRQTVDGYPVLVVVESAGALPKGAALALIPSENRLAFEVDLGLARRLGFNVSAKLLQLARKVY